MMEEKIYETLNEIFQDVFDDEDIVVDAGTNSDTIEDWDSLEHINLVVAIEKAFGLKFSMDEVTGMKNVGEMVEIIKARGTKL
ncbi:MAG: acyl carrier protein [Lachnospiraceae bacterium]|nr:acyl carrier protein [Lachnospiraceae bacterium]MBR3642213.1 acyl carrier protein [Parasporobacterium sp.]MBR2843516.1 acyl carrier protein [Lachnospiraceae bacterium]MBR3262363.1 acyl carrier protein [Lachnospiraceae bacterium]MBR3361484.1 acyl carrier protein [Lachnospiraceae bacterium]